MFRATLVIENATTWSQYVDTFEIKDEIVNPNGLFAVVDESIKTYVRVQNEIMNETLLTTVKENVERSWC